MNQYIFLVIVLFFAFMACNDDEISTDPFDCEFVEIAGNMDGLIDETEKDIMQTCLDNRIIDQGDIENILEGEWILIGHGSGWVASDQQPCARIEISEEELTFEFENAWIDTVVIDEWNLETHPSDSSIFFLKAKSGFLEGLQLNVFCDQYMYVNDTPVDGNMYLYEKK